jgi:hypothetical protein
VAAGAGQLVVDRIDEYERYLAARRSPAGRELSFIEFVSPLDDPGTWCRWEEVKTRIGERYPFATGRRLDGLLDAAHEVVVSDDAGEYFDDRLAKALALTWRELRDWRRGAGYAAIGPGPIVWIRTLARPREHRPGRRRRSTARSKPDGEDPDPAGGRDHEPDVAGSVA